MTDVAQQMTDELRRITDLVADPDTATGDILAAPSTTSISCDITAVLRDSGPTVTAHGHVSPGGRVRYAWLEAEDGGATARADVRAGSGLHKALQLWFEDHWTSWDEVPDDTPGEVITASASQLIPGDRVYRLDLVVAGVEDAGVDTSGEKLVEVTFEDNPGREVWRADRQITIVGRDIIG